MDDKLHQNLWEYTESVKAFMDYWFELGVLAKQVQLSGPGVDLNEKLQEFQDAYDSFRTDYLNPLNQLAQHYVGSSIDTKYITEPEHKALVDVDSIERLVSGLEDFGSRFEKEMVIPVQFEPLRSATGQFNYRLESYGSLVRPWHEPSNLLMLLAEYKDSLAPPEPKSNMFSEGLPIQTVASGKTAETSPYTASSTEDLNTGVETGLEKGTDPTQL